MLEKNTDKENDIESYTFKSFQENDLTTRADKITDFQIENFSNRNVEDEKELIKERREERVASENSGFQIASIVRKHRGIEQDAHNEYEDKIEKEVERRFQMIKEEGYAQGFEEGIKKGQDEIFTQMRSEVDEKLLSLTEMISNVLSQRDEILSVQKTQIFTMVKNLTKWIILRELEGDGEYLARLLEKLVVELQTKSNILIQVSKKQFEHMPEVLEVVEAKIGKLDNVRVEVDYDINDSGLILSSENGIINGSLEQQFTNLSKLFESVGVENGAE